MAFTLVAHPDVVKAELPAGSRVLSAELLGVSDLGPVKLKEGRWEGDPYAAGGSSRPTVTVVREFCRTGDVDRDGRPDTLFFLEVEVGGSGTMVLMSLLSGRPSFPLHAVPLGDRVQVRSAVIRANGLIEVTMVQAGANDAACCPGELVIRTWTWARSQWKEHHGRRIGRLSAEVLDSTQWILSSWSRSEPADTSFEVSLSFASDRIAGKAACNRYFASVQEGSYPGAVTFSGTGATRMMCEPAAMKVEDRYLSLVNGIRRFGFYYGRLFLESVHEGEPVLLLFNPAWSEQAHTTKKR